MILEDKKLRIHGYKKKWADANKEKIKINRQKNSEKAKAYQKIYREINKDKYKKYSKEYYEQNSDKLKTQANKYRKSNKNKINKHYNDRRKTDELFKLSCNIRNLIGNSIRNRNFSKNSKTNQILGCSFEEFKVYIESKFEPWMNWGNHGNWNGIPNKVNVAWDIDHIIPPSYAMTHEEIIKLNHYTNLQPLCSYYNRWIKVNKVVN